MGQQIDFLYEPSVEELFMRAVPHFVKAKFYKILAESFAAENAARMSAMESATKNAQEVIDDINDFQ